MLAPQDTSFSPLSGQILFHGFIPASGDKESARAPVTVTRVLFYYYVRDIVGGEREVVNPPKSLVISAPASRARNSISEF